MGPRQKCRGFHLARQILGRDFLRGLFHFLFWLFGFLFLRLEIFVAGKFGLAFAAEIWYNMRQKVSKGKVGYCYG
jgi:hypothetical protein